MQEMHDIGQQIIDEIIAGGLCHAECAEDSSHGCVVVWSSGAAEQLEAIVDREVWRKWRKITSSLFFALENLKAERAKNAELVAYVQALEEQCDSIALQKARHVAKLSSNSNE